MTVPITTLPTLFLSEVRLGAQVGFGGFSVVYELASIHVDPSISRAAAQQEQIQRLTDSCYFAPSVTRSSQDCNCKYVVKCLRDDLPADEFVKGYNDLVTESNILKALSHEHVIAVRALPPTQHDGGILGGRYFIVLDRLSCTLQTKLAMWKQLLDAEAATTITTTNSSSSLVDSNTLAEPSFFGSLFSCLWTPDINSRHYSSGFKSLLLRLWLERFIVLRDIASALHYLHQQGIIYRDLKPENIGFSHHQGIVKVFDFGLAKHLSEKDRLAPQSDLYKLTGNTGSLRYMAPEVALGHPYNSSVDSYSFAILFWQLCSLTTPFDGFTCKMHSDLVVHQGFRPSIEDYTWPCTWKEIMTQGWSVRITDRPSLENIHSTLIKEVEKIIHIEDYFESGEALPSLSSTLTSTYSTYSSENPL